MSPRLIVASSPSNIAVFEACLYTLSNNGKFKKSATDWEDKYNKLVESQEEAKKKSIRNERTNAFFNISVVNFGFATSLWNAPTSFFLSSSSHSLAPWNFPVCSLVNLSEGNYVSKEKFDNKETEISTLKTQVEDANKEIQHDFHNFVHRTVICWS